MSSSASIKAAMSASGKNVEKAPQNAKPTIISICGIPGSGKSFLVQALKQHLGTVNFTYHEGSTMIDALVPGGLEAFKMLHAPNKLFWREKAIEALAQQAAASNKAAIVASHYSFWNNEADAEPADLAWTSKDGETYTQVIYLAVSPELIASRRNEDRTCGRRTRPALSVDHLRRWQRWELDQLGISLSSKPQILFAQVKVSDETGESWAQTVSRFAALFDDFRVHSERENLSRALAHFRELLPGGNGLSAARLETILFLDADKTLGPADTGEMFWEQFPWDKEWRKPLGKFPLRKIFRSMGYTYEAFRHAALLYEEVDINFGEMGNGVASEVALYLEMRTMLKDVAAADHVKAIVVTSGLGRVWKKVLQREGLGERIEVISGSHISDGFVVTPAVKAALVRYVHKAFPCVSTWAFGDSPVDLPMLRAANNAIVIVGPMDTRSRSMEADLEDAVTHRCLKARQAVMASSSVPGEPSLPLLPRLDPTRLPLVRLDGPRFINELLVRQAQVLRADTGNPRAACLLATPMRDAQVSGHALREAHRKVGWFLAVTCVGNVLGVEPFEMLHVQGDGKATQGWRLCDEPRMTVVPLMRAGEGMGMGVSEAFPQASLVHAREPEDLKVQHIKGRSAVVLVDAVVNTGKTMMSFLERVREVEPEIRIVVVAGVVQKEVLEEGGCLAEDLKRGTKVVALRVSDNKFTGTGGADTGNRLFNTAYLP